MPLTLEQVQDRAFMILETDHRIYQCWYAVDNRQLQRLPSLASKMASDKIAATQDHFVPLAGSRRTPTVDSPRVRIANGSAGLLMAANQLSDRSIQLLIETCIIQ